MSDNREDLLIFEGGGTARRARYVPDRERLLQLQTYLNNSRTSDK